MAECEEFERREMLEELQEMAGIIDNVVVASDEAQPETKVFVLKKSETEELFLSHDTDSDFYLVNRTYENIARIGDYGERKKGSYHYRILAFTGAGMIMAANVSKGTIATTSAEVRDLDAERDSGEVNNYLENIVNASDEKAKERHERALGVFVTRTKVMVKAELGIS